MTRRKVKGVLVDTQKMIFNSYNSLEAEVGTTGFCGGDSGYGGRTFIRFADLTSTDMTVKCNANVYGNSSVTITLGGDSELKTMIAALEFILDQLKRTTDLSGESLKHMGTVENAASWKQISFIQHLCEEKGLVLINIELLTKPIAGRIIGFLKQKNKQEIPESLREFIKISDEKIKEQKDTKDSNG